MMWQFNTFLPTNFSLQMWHSKSFSPVWVLSWAAQTAFSKNPLPPAYRVYLCDFPRNNEMNKLSIYWPELPSDSDVLNLYVDWREVNPSRKSRTHEPKARLIFFSNGKKKITSAGSIPWAYFLGRKVTSIFSQWHAVLRVVNTPAALTWWASLLRMYIWSDSFWMWQISRSDQVRKT